MSSFLCKKSGAYFYFDSVAFHELSGKSKEKILSQLLTENKSRPV